MLTRRNWLLRCSIFINILVILYLCSYVMLGNSGNFSSGPAFFIPEEVPKIRQLTENIINEDEILSQTKEQVENNISSGLSQQKLTSKQKKEEIIKLDSLNNLNSLSGIVIKDQNTGKKIEQELNDDRRFIIPTDQNYSIQESLSNDANVQEHVNFVNNSNGDNLIASNNEKEFFEHLRSILKCLNKNFIPEITERGDFWILKNYIRAEHGAIDCHTTITYTTHADYTFLDNLIPLIQRWNAPISVALYAPGNDFNPTLNTIKYLRDCLSESFLVRKFVTFHIYFSTKHIPKRVPKYYEVLNVQFNCTLPSPLLNVSSSQLYKNQQKLLYPVNVGRNIARDAAMTHFILASDIELYPNPGLVKKFLEMIVRNDPPLQRKSPRVFPLPIFEVEISAPIPKDKTELLELIRTKKAIPFHKYVCPTCHGIPKSKEWLATNETEDLGVFHIGKRTGSYVHWEPIYIGTHIDPHYDERLSWEGKSDKMSQGYVLCVLDYEFHILDNSFLVHKPGIKLPKRDHKRDMIAAETSRLIKKNIFPELQVLYGTRKGCAI